MNKDEALSFLKDFIHKIDTQENACTARPILIELTATRQHFTEHTGGWNGGWWRDDSDFECKPVEASSEEEAAKKLSEYYGEPVNEEDLMELDLFEYEEVLQTFLTHEAYDEHVRLNGHNLPKGYFKYIRHATRDPELVKMFDAIRAVAEDSSVSDQCTCDSPTLVTHPGDETFGPRSGCLKCNVWFDKPHLRRSIK